MKSGWGFPTVCFSKIAFSASSKETSTKLSDVFSLFSMISRRFFVSSSAFSWIICLKTAVFVSSATCEGVSAEPMICAMDALLGPCRSHEWCAEIWVRRSCA